MIQADLMPGKKAVSEAAAESVAQAPARPQVSAIIPCLNADKTPGVLAKLAITARQAVR